MARDETRFVFSRIERDALTLKEGAGTLEEAGELSESIAGQVTAPRKIIQADA